MCHDCLFSPPHADVLSTFLIVACYLLDCLIVCASADIFIAFFILYTLMGNIKYFERILDSNIINFDCSLRLAKV